MKIVITSDNTCDIPPELIKKHDIKIIAIPVIMGDEEYRDNINGEKIFDYVAKTGTLPKTAALSEYDYKEFFEKHLKKADAIIHFALSFGISATGPNAQKAAESLENVYVIDTKALSSGSGLLVLSAVDKIQEGKEAIQIVEELKAEAENIQTSFLINKLDYLKKGGRCSSVAAFGANLLGLKIMIDMVDGKLQAGKKYMGKMEIALSKYLKDLIKEKPPIYNRVFVTSSSPMPGIKEALVVEVKALGFKEVLTADACSTICSHCGPDTIGVLYQKES